MSTGRFSSVIVEPHQKHVTGQSDLETALHTLLDHLREPLMAIKGSATDFSHVFNRSFHLGEHKPKNISGGYTRVFAPRIDMRETNQAYYIDMELPGVHDLSGLSIIWRSDRELLVEGVLERPAVQDVLGLNAHSNSHSNGMNRTRSETQDLETGLARASGNNYSTSNAPAYVVADEANGFEKNEDLAPQDLPESSQLANAPTGANSFQRHEDKLPVAYSDFQRQNDPSIMQRRLREQANPFVPAAASNGHQTNEDPFPVDIVGGKQLDEGDAHRVQVPMHHLPNGDEFNAGQACVSIGERGVGRFMRCFVFPHMVDAQGLKSEMVDGLLRIGVPKTDSRHMQERREQRAAVGTVE
jgi:HSP20 family molecular chaperone IbpA